MIIVYFLTWTLLLYWIHRISHKVKFVSKFHNNHHAYINKYGNSGWHPNNLLLINDNLYGTIDLWITEVIPTILFSLVTGQWWISIFYYLWAALIQETVEHNSKLNLPLITIGKWHLLHHKKFTKNYGLFFPLWDLVFGTYQHVD